MTVKELIQFLVTCDQKSKIFYLEKHTEYPELDNLKRITEYNEYFNNDLHEHIVLLRS